MLVRLSCRRSWRILQPFGATRTTHRNLLTLAIETSCDDTSVAILERTESPLSHCLHLHEKVTADNSLFRGIHPAVAIVSHQQVLSNLINQSLHALPDLECVPGCEASNAIQVHCRNGGWVRKQRPDFVAVTRGPGITAALATGLDTAKGLAVAWQVPFIGVNHMQAHALTPRLVHALENPGQDVVMPSFPYLSLLVSGGHTILVLTKSTSEHSILASTIDLALGDAMDKIARSILPSDKLSGKDVMYGRILERFAFERGVESHQYVPPRSRSEEVTPKPTRWGWALPVPFADKRAMSFTFAGLGSAVKRICDEAAGGMSRAERIELAREAMRVAFEHLATRVVWALGDLPQNEQGVSVLVVSGGVASNAYLRTILRSMLDAHKLSNIDLIHPPIELCVDNAAMIAWTGMEMHDQGLSTDLSCLAERKLSI